MTALTFEQALKYRSDQARDNRGRWTDEGRHWNAVDDSTLEGLRHLLLTRYKLKPREAAAGLERRLGLKQFKGKTRAEFMSWLKRVTRSVPKDKLLNEALELRPAKPQSLTEEFRRLTGEEGSGFAHAYDRLKGLSRGQVVEVVNSILRYPLPKSTTKQQALDALQHLHRSGLGFGRHLRATRGRTAG